MAVRAGRLMRLTPAVASALGLTAVLAAAGQAPPGGTDPGLRRHEATRLSMASVYAIEAWAPPEVPLPAVVDAAFDEVDRIDRLMSHYRADSPISRLNREAAAGPIAVEAELFDFLAEALRYARESDGAFDITVGPLMRAWGFFRGDGRMPSGTELARARRSVGWRHVVLDRARRTVRFAVPGVELDLGGIAKGYAVDRAVGILRARGVPAALVSAGGSTVYALGAPPGRPGWTVDVQDPLQADRVARTFTLTDRALSVSGSSEKAFERDGVRYSHLMDPRTGRPVQGLLSVVVLARTGTAGDALDNACFVLGPAGSRACLSIHPETDVFFFLPDGPGGWKAEHRRGGR